MDSKNQNWLVVAFTLCVGSVLAVQPNVSEGQLDSAFPRIQIPQQHSDTIQQKQLRNKVKLIFDHNANTLTLIGAKEDVEIVKRTIATFNQALKAKSQRTTAKVRVHFQLAETVVDILKNSLESHGINNSGLKISALHFPEAVFLVGPPAAVKHAKSIIEKVDSHDLFTLEHR